MSDKMHHLYFPKCNYIWYYFIGKMAMCLFYLRWWAMGQYVSSFLSFFFSFFLSLRRKTWSKPVFFITNLKCQILCEKKYKYLTIITSQQQTEWVERCFKIAFNTVSNDKLFMLMNIIIGKKTKSIRKFHD